MDPSRVVLPPILTSKAALLLALGEAGPGCGGELATRVRSRTGGLVDVPDGSLYPALGQLAEEKLVREKRGEGRRRDFELTAKGAAAVAGIRRLLGALVGCRCGTAAPAPARPVGASPPAAAPTVAPPRAKPVAGPGGVAGKRIDKLVIDDPILAADAGGVQPEAPPVQESAPPFNPEADPSTSGPILQPEAGAVDDRVVELDPEVAAAKPAARPPGRHVELDPAASRRR